jgi:UDP-N-acetylmuramate: L-alanyl-gamma-D-glutamyl-meso-diaminopimelate ligase
MSDFLAATGIAVREGYGPENLPAEPALVVIGNALSRGNPEVEAVLARRMEYVSLPEMLRRHFLGGGRNLVVCGTHGKTTTSSMLAWILEGAGLAPDFLIGGLPRNFGVGARFAGSRFTVLEGDEYDTAFFDKRSKFLHYLPEVAVINNIEFDHADIFANLEEIKTSFRRLLRIVPGDGLVVANGDDANSLEVAAEAFSPVLTVGFGAACGLRIEDVEYAPGRSVFRLGDARFTVPMDGEFNVRNAAMAVAAARRAGVADREAAAALAAFTGVGRRQEERGEKRGVRVIDDFAHHPTAVRQVIHSMRQRHPEARIWAIFEPRSNTTRRNVFQDELASALAEADQVVLSTVEDNGKIPPGERLDAGLLARRLCEAGRGGWLEEGADAVVRRVAPAAAAGDILLVLSNGGFGGIHGKLLAAL